MPDLPPSKPPADLLDPHCSHVRQHGERVHHVTQSTRLGVTRSHAHAYITSSRDGRAGGLPVVVVHLHASPMGAYLCMTTEDADAMAESLRAAAVTAREVAAALNLPGYCK